MRAYAIFMFGFVVACSNNGNDAVSGDQQTAAVGGAAPAASANAGAKAASTSASAPGPAGAAGAGARPAAGGAAATPPRASGASGASGAKAAGTGGVAAAAPTADAPTAGSSNTAGAPTAASSSTPAAGSGGAEAPALMGVGNCCSAHDTPGCGNADLQVCVCEQLPSCCTDKWDTACTFIVTQKHCQPGIRECVCGSASDQWGQGQCCEQRWSNTCDEVAESKCGAEPGCF